MEAGLRFPMSGFLIDVLNLLKLTPMQLIPSSYGQLLTLYLLFRRNELPPPSNNVIKHCFALKQCPLPRSSYEDSLHEGLYHLVVRVDEHKGLLQGNPSLNNGEYKTSYCFVKGPEIELLHRSFVLKPGELVSYPIFFTFAMYLLSSFVCLQMVWARILFFLRRRKRCSTPSQPWSRRIYGSSMRISGLLRAHGGIQTRL
ncbi:hypothetical protein ACOSP7_023952 [Xanthoceras sorbifolium]